LIERVILIRIFYNEKCVELKTGMQKNFQFQLMCVSLIGVLGDVKPVVRCTICSPIARVNTHSIFHAFRLGDAIRRKQGTNYIGRNSWHPALCSRTLYARSMFSIDTILPRNFHEQLQLREEKDIKSYC